MDAESYHLAELALARSDRQSLPEIPDWCRRVLDVGCGAGQTLVASGRPETIRFGIDRDLDALRLGKRIQAPPTLICAAGEKLPFRDASFDFLYSRVALPYMNIPAALRDFHRVLRPGGGIWISLHSLSRLSWKEALQSPRKLAFEMYRLANTAALHFAGSQFHYPLRRWRMESYQTESGMRRVLADAGFERIGIQRGQRFIMSAYKPEGAATRR